MDFSEEHMEKPADKNLKLQSTKHSLSNLKRIESLKQKKDQRKIQQQLIRTALSTLDSKQAQPKKKIFDDSDDLNSETLNGTLEMCIDKAPAKRKLFASSDSESDTEKDSNNQKNKLDTFQIKPQFEGKRGMKLLKLQTKFKDDKRFQLDERFLESGCQSSEDEKSGKEVESELTDMAERQKNLKVLQEVLGVQLPIDSFHGSGKAAFRDLSSLRFDPTSESASKLEIKREKNVAQKAKNDGTKKTDITSPSICVSKDRFYEISSSLKSAFTKSSVQSTGFSFLKTSGQDETNQNDMVTDAYSTKIDNLSSRLKRVLCDKNSLHFDSSDDDGEMPNGENPPAKLITEQTHSVRSLQDKKCFFLNMDDQCLKDGVEFFHRHKSLDLVKEEWEAVKPDLLEMMYTKRRRAFHKRKGKPSKIKRNNFKNR